MGIIQSVVDLFKADKVVTSVRGSGFITSAEFRSVRGGFTIGLRFKQPVKDGNRVARVNVRNEEYGQVVSRIDLHPGEKSYHLSLEDRPDPTEYGLVVIGEDGEIVSDQTLVIEHISP